MKKLLSSRCHTATSFRTGRAVFWLLSAGLLMLGASGRATAQTSKPAGSQLVRLAKLEIYPAELENYKAAARKEIEAALRLEPGVVTLYAVAEKDHPTRITILEIYASQEAYQAHLLTPHFLQYKKGTQHMVKSLELIETEPLLPRAKVK